MEKREVADEWEDWESWEDPLRDIDSDEEPQSSPSTSPSEQIQEKKEKEREKEKDEREEKGGGVARDGNLTASEWIIASSHPVGTLPCQAFGLCVQDEQNISRVWTQERLLKFLAGSRGGKLKSKKLIKAAKDASGLNAFLSPFFPEICALLTENSCAIFRFTSEKELKLDFASGYLDEHMEGLTVLQRLTHDRRGANFIMESFPDLTLNECLQWGAEGTQDAPKMGVVEIEPRDSNAETWKPICGKILRLFANPPGDYKRNVGNLWIFRSMSLRSARYLDAKFATMREAAGRVAMMLATGATMEDVADILHEHFPTQPTREQKVSGETRSPLWFALHGHFGDLVQGLTYSHERKEEKTKVLVGFEFRPLAELVLFSPLVACLTGEHVDLTGQQPGKGFPIVTAMLKKFGRVNRGHGSDGIVNGYLSIKHEGRGDFSFGLANNSMSYVLFSLLVSGIKVFGRLD